MKLTVGSLFAGIDGFGLGLEKAGFELRWQVEIDAWCRKVLSKHWPAVPKYDDIRKCGSHNLEPVDLICGGFPCQPFSVAGKQRGAEDDRHLWPEMLRVIKELKPSWVIGENVAGLVSMAERIGDVRVEGKTVVSTSESDSYSAVWIHKERMLLNDICEDLENLGYETVPLVIPACGLDAPHRRDRVWIVAHSEHTERRPCKPGRNDRDRKTAEREEKTGRAGASSENGRSRTMAHAEGERRRRSGDGGCATPTDTNGDGRSGILRQAGQRKDGPQLGTDLDGESAGTGRPGPSCQQTSPHPSCKDDGCSHSESIDGQVQQPGKCSCAGDVSYNNGPGCKELHTSQKPDGPGSSPGPSVEGGAVWPVEPGVGRVADGVPRRVDRLGGLGNAVTHQIPEVIGRMIIEVERLTKKERDGY